MNQELKLISEAYINMIQSNNEPSLTEMQLDVMSFEEVNELIENYDQLDELSKSTLGSFIKKAGIARNSERDKEMAAHIDISDDSDPKAQWRHSDKANGHRLAIMRAKKKVNGDKTPTYFATDPRYKAGSWNVKKPS